NMALLASLRQRARTIRRELLALALAARHPSTPWYAKLVIAGCVAYALTPVVFIPLAIALAVRFVPAPVLADCRARSHELDARVPRLSRAAWWLIAAAWLGTVMLVAAWTVL